MFKKKKKFSLPLFLSRRFLHIFCILSFLLLGFFIYLVYFKAIPHVSSSINLHRSYANEFSSNFKDYLYSIEKLVKTTTETEDFSRIVNQTLNDRQFIIKAEGNNLIPKPIKYVSLEFSRDATQEERQFFLRDKELFFSIRYSNAYFAVNRMNFAFDFKEVLAELLQTESSLHNVFLGKHGNVFLIDKGLKQDSELLKRLDAHFGQPLDKENIFYLESYGLTLYESVIPNLNRNIFFIYKDTQFSVPYLSTFILIYLTLQSLALLVFVLWSDMYGKIPKSRDRKERVNQEILELLKGIDEGRNAFLLKKLTREEKIEFIKEELKNKWAKMEDFLDFLEQRFGDKVYAFTFELDREKNEYIYSGRRYFISERFKGFSFKKGAEIVRLLQKNNVLSIRTEEAEKSFIDQYLDLLDKQVCEEIYFVPFFVKNQLEGIIIFGL